MIIGSEVKARVHELLAEGRSLEQVLYQVTQENLVHLPEHLKEDPQEVSTVLSAVQFFAHEVHPEFISGAALHDLVLLRLLPKKKTERFILERQKEARGE